MCPNTFTGQDNPNASSRMGRCGTNWNENIVGYSSNQHDNKNFYYQNNHDQDHNYQQPPD
jgi:hypothetical protein